MDITRRQLLRGAAVTALAGAVTACTDSSSSRANGDGEPTVAAADRLLPFYGRHQVGVTAPLTAAGLVMALDVRAADRAELAETLQGLSDSLAKVMSGEGYERLDGGFPAADSGILGPEPGPAGISVVVGFGDSLFDDRFGLGDRRPPELQPMPHFPNDILVTPERSGGDLSLAITADSHEATVFALRQVLRENRGRFVPRWSKDGFNQLLPTARPGRAPGRNLLGFLDGTANLDTTDGQLMDAHIWTQADDGLPDWAVGGTYQAVRVIRMLVEFWDRTRLNEQEAIFGRHRDSGAPLGGSEESETPVFGDNLESHIARANPRTPGSERNLILRKGFNYASGLDENDQLDQGLLFMSFQRSLENGFLAVQRRLDGERLEEYIRPLGGGFFFVPPAPADGEFLGQRLVA